MLIRNQVTSDRFQTYSCPAAIGDVVHHAAAWVMKEPDKQPKFLFCRAVEDTQNERGWNIVAETWERNEIGGWGIANSEMHPEFSDAADGAQLAQEFGCEWAALPYPVFREVVNEHDKNYLLALAIAIDALPESATKDNVSKVIRENADADLAERRKAVMPDQRGLKGAFARGSDAACAINNMEQSPAITRNVNERA